jgi:hypothetical protein
MDLTNLISIDINFSIKLSNEVTNTSGPEQQSGLTYSKEKLLALRECVYHRIALNKLPTETVTRINNRGIQKRRKRGSRGGVKHLNDKHQNMHP